MMHRAICPDILPTYAAGTLRQATHKSEMTTQTVSCVPINNEVQLISKLQHTGTRSAAA
jgi:hypothetical protein